MVLEKGKILTRQNTIDSINSVRKNKTNDIVKRIGVISPNKLFLRNLPIEHPVASFNPGMIFNDDTDCLHIYPRIILGYYMYVSSIAEIKVCIDELEQKTLEINRYMADVIITPDNRHDIWGTEDPRMYRINNKIYTTYTGRAINYFNPMEWRNRTRPVLAVLDEKRRKWVKKASFIPDEKVFGDIISDKNAFLIEKDDRIFLFHRIHTKTDSFKAIISLVEREYIEGKHDGIKEVKVDNGIEIIGHGTWESKIGWGTPPIEVETNKYVVLVHSVDKEGVVYRVFSVLIDLSGKEPQILGVTPTYIMEPKTSYEVTGDRPLVVFPCGAVKIDDELIISYGAADLYIGIGKINLSELLSIIDTGKIE